jgi:hypothetical protein
MAAHIGEDALERYAMDRLPEAEAAPVPIPSHTILKFGYSIHQPCVTFRLRFLLC